MGLLSVDAGAGVRLAFAVLLCALAGCAGGSSSSGAPSTPPPPPATVPVAPPAVVGLAPGQQVSGISIMVPAPALGPAINAQDLGVTSGLSGEAFNTGDQ